MDGAAGAPLKIYTKTGDDGTTGLVGGRRIHKTDPRSEAIGTVDELNAAIGLCRAQARQTEVDRVLQTIQSHLFQMGAELASPDEGRHAIRTLKLDHAEELERSIDEMSGTLEPLRYFILPGGSALAAQLHMARTICRRAERRTLTLSSVEGVRDVIPVYLNRLSDWLFIAARWANHLENVEDIKWISEEI